MDISYSIKSRKLYNYSVLLSDTLTGGNIHRSI